MLVKVEALADLADLPLGEIALVEETPRIGRMIDSGLLRRIVTDPAPTETAEVPLQEPLLGSTQGPRGEPLVDVLEGFLDEPGAT